LSCRILTLTTWRIRFRVALNGSPRFTRCIPATFSQPAPTIEGSIRSWTAINIELTCEGCGTLHIAVRDDLKRTWARITRLQHKQSGEEGAHTKQPGGKYAPSK